MEGNLTTSRAVTARVIVSPMGVGEVLDAGLNLARRNFRRLFLVGALGLVTTDLVVTLISRGLSPDPLAATSAASIAATFISSVLSGLGHGATGVAILMACAAVINGTLASPIGEFYRQSLRKLWPFLGWTMLVGLAAIPLIIVFPLGVWVGIRWSQSWSVLALESVGPIHALRRSWELTRGSWWHTFGALFLVGVLSSIITYVFAGLVGVVVFAIGTSSGGGVTSIMQAAGTFTTNPLVAIIASLLSSLSSAAVYPFGTMISVVLYFELRARAEGYDLEQRSPQSISE